MLIGTLCLDGAIYLGRRSYTFSDIVQQRVLSVVVGCAQEAPCRRRDIACFRAGLKVVVLSLDPVRAHPILVTLSSSTCEKCQI